MDAEDLRQIAIRRAAQGSQLVLRVENQTEDCPMHGDEDHRHLSRKEMARELRLMAAKQEREARETRSNGARRSSSFSPGPASPNKYEWQRSQSLDPYSHSYNSIPRRASTRPHTRSTRHGSIADQGHSFSPPRDVFKGRVDFKSILRRFDPKDDERMSGGRLVAPRPDYQPNPPPPQRGAIVDSDFDFRGSAPTLSNFPHQQYKSQPYQVSVIHQPGAIRPQKPQRLDLKIPPSTTSNTRDFVISPTSFSNPVSPKRVEFSEQVYFSFSGDDGRVSSPAPGSRVKPILRQPHDQPLSLIEQYQQQEIERKYKAQMASPLVIEHANLDETTNDVDKDPSSNQRRKVSGESLVKIYIPPTEENKDEAPGDDDDDDDTISAASDKEEEEVKDKLEVKKAAVRTLSADPQPKRQVPPMLTEYPNRSQSFPLPGKSKVGGQDETGIFQEGLPRKHSLPLTSSSLSISSNPNEGKNEATNHDKNRCSHNHFLSSMRAFSRKNTLCIIYVPEW